MSRKQKKYHYIYKTACIITGKFYVGMHSTDNLEDGYLGSGKILGYSISRHGRENHVREILEFCSSREELKQREKEIVNEELLAQPLNINLKYGGDGGWAIPSAANKQQSSARLKARHADGRVRYDTFTGRTHDEATKAKIGKANAIRQAGLGNSQFGVKRVGMNKDGQIKKVLPEQVESFLLAGWKRGFRPAVIGSHGREDDKYLAMADANDPAQQTKAA